MACWMLPMAWLIGSTWCAGAGWPAVASPPAEAAGAGAAAAGLLSPNDGVPVTAVPVPGTGTNPLPPGENAGTAGALLLGAELVEALLLAAGLSAAAAAA